MHKISSIYIYDLFQTQILHFQNMKKKMCYLKKQVCYYRDFDVWYCSTLRFGRVDDKGTMVGLTKDS